MVDEVEGKDTGAEGDGADEAAVDAAIALDDEGTTHGGRDEEDDGEGAETPTKKRRAFQPRSTTALPSDVPAPTTAGTISAKRASESVSAFLALRPGATPRGDTSASAGKRKAVDMKDEFEHALRTGSKRASASTGARGVRAPKKAVRCKRDWTYRELKWTGDEVMSRHEAQLRRLDSLRDRDE